MTQHSERRAQLWQTRRAVYSTTKSKLSPFGGAWRSHTALTVAAMSDRVSAMVASRRAAPVRLWAEAGGAGWGNRSCSIRGGTSRYKSRPAAAAVPSVAAAERSGAASAPRAHPAANTPAQRQRSPGYSAAAPSVPSATASAAKLKEGVAAVTAAASATASTALCSRLAAKAAHSPASANSARPGANQVRASRWAQAASMASHRQAPRDLPAGRVCMARPKPAASAAVQASRAASAGVGRAGKPAASCAAASTAQPMAAANPYRPGRSRRAISAAAAPSASGTACSSGKKRQPAHHSTQRRRRQIPRRAADDQCQPKGRGAAVDLPGPQQDAGAGGSQLPGQRRDLYPGGRQPGPGRPGRGGRRGGLRLWLGARRCGGAVYGGFLDGVRHGGSLPKRPRGWRRAGTGPGPSRLRPRLCGRRTHEYSGPPARFLPQGGEAPKPSKTGAKHPRGRVFPQIAPAKAANLRPAPQSPPHRRFPPFRGANAPTPRPFAAGRARPRHKQAAASTCTFFDRKPISNKNRPGKAGPLSPAGSCHILPCSAAGGRPAWPASPVPAWPSGYRRHNGRRPAPHPAARPPAGSRSSGTPAERAG